MTTQRPLTKVLNDIGDRLDKLNEIMVNLEALIVLNKKENFRTRLKSLVVIVFVFVVVFLSLGAIHQTTNELAAGKQVRLNTIYSNCISINNSNSVIRDLVTAALTPAKAPTGLTPDAFKAWEATQIASRQRATKFAALVKQRTETHPCK